MLHGKAMTNVIAYDMYLELAEGGVDPAWKLDKKDIVDFYIFRETLSRQMLAYTPKACKYLGDDKFRDYTAVAKAKRARSPVPPPTADEDGIAATDAGVTAGVLKQHGVRLCGFLGDVSEHFDACQTMEDKGKKLKCVFCGKCTYQFCGICGVAVHKFPQPNVGDGVTSCFFRYHDSGCFGLARDDWKITNKKRMKDWSYPTMEEFKTNEQQMKTLSSQVNSPAVAVGNNSNGGATNGGNGRITPSSVAADIDIDIESESE
jgi:hypothetical protein